MKIAFIPIDNRPVCSTLAQMTAEIDDYIEFSTPPREFAGGLTKTADINALIDWLEHLEPQDALILPLDTLIYGGLIPSRRCEGDLDFFKKRVGKLKNILTDKCAKIYAVSSIMRISNNNINQEEKEYWAQYGEKIFKYSYDMSKNGFAQTDVPQEILNDYLQTRKRNFEINKILLNLKNEKIFDTLVFSKDDCASYGFNVDEAKELEVLGGFTKTGADEIPLSLLSRAITDYYKQKIKICPIFLEPEHKNLISNYEDVSVVDSVRGQIELAGCEISAQNEADILLYVNNFKKRQGEIVMNTPTEMFEGNFAPPQKPYITADVCFANGADNNFINALFKNDIDDKYFYGYSGWNTTANTLGSLICAALVKFFARRYNKDNFLKLQTVRFLDDWAYQANIRQTLKEPDIYKLAAEMKPYEEIIADKLNKNFEIEYSFPWDRLFETEVRIIK